MSEAGRPGNRSVAGNAAWMMAAEVVGKVSSLVLVIILARGFGPRQYGFFAFALAFFPLFLHLARWGIDVVSLRRMAMDDSEFSTVMVNGGTLRVGLAAAATAFGLVLVPFFVSDGNAPLAAIVVVAVALFVDEAVVFQTVAFTAFERMRFNALILIANRVLSTALAGAVVLGGGGLVAVCVAYLLGSVGAVAFGTMVLARSFPPLHWGDLRRSEMVALLRQGAPFGVASFLNMATFRLDTVLLGVLKGPIAVGFYGVAYRFFEPLLFVSWSIAQAVTPRFVHESQSEGTEETRTFELAAAALITLYLPIAIGAPFAAEWLLGLLFGEEYAGARGAVVWLAAAAGPYGIAYLARMAAVAAGERSGITKVAALVLLLNVILNIVLIPRHGVAGAAAATFVTEIFDCALLLGLYARRGGTVRFTRAIAVPFLAGGCMLLALLPAARGVAALAIGPVVFVIAMVVVGRILAPGDARSLVAALRSRQPA